MPKKFVFSVNNDVQFEGKLHTGRCSAHTKAGTRCKRHCIIGYEYCYTHLEKDKELKIKDSTIPQADKGLFAFNHTKPDNQVIFRKDQTIADYNGQLINEATRQQRYGQYTAPYAIRIGPNTISDGALRRTVGSLANTRPGHNNATISVNPQMRTAKIKATQPIRNNNEIFVSYGRSYQLHQPNVRFATKNTR
jgi:hypothetical protein